MAEADPPVGASASYPPPDSAASIAGATDEQLQLVLQQLQTLTMRLYRVEQQLGLGPFQEATPLPQAVPLASPSTDPSTLPPFAPPMPFAIASSLGLTEDVGHVRGLLSSIADNFTGEATKREATEAMVTPPSQITPSQTTNAPQRVTTGTYTNPVPPSAASAPPRATSSDADEEKPGLPLGVSDWERLIGGKGFLWMGVLIVFLAVAFLLAMTWQTWSKPLFTPQMQLACGTLCGVLFLGMGVRTRGKAQSWFSESLLGTGLALFYLTIWAGTQRYGLVPQSMGFALMSLVTIGGAALSVRLDALSLIVVATLGGFLTPILLQQKAVGGSDNALGFLTYVSLLDAGILAVSVFKAWRSVVWLAWCSTVLLLLGWATGTHWETMRWTIFAFVTFDFLLFVGAATARSLRERTLTEPDDLLFLLANTLGYAWVGFALVKAVSGALPAAFPLALALFLASFGFLTWRMSAHNRLLREGAWGLGLLAVTIAVPVQLRQNALAMTWSAEATLLLVLAARFGSPLLRRAGQSVWGLSLCAVALAWSMAHAGTHPFLNPRSLPLLFSALTTMGFALYLAPPRATREPAEWPDEIAPCYAAYATLAGAWLLAQEIYEAFARNGGNAKIPAGAQGPQWLAATFLCVAITWCFYALPMFWLGHQRRNLALRLSAFAVIAGATVLPVWASIAGESGLMAPNEALPFGGLRLIAYGVVAASLGLLGWFMARDRVRDDDREPRLDAMEVEALGVLPSAVALLVLLGLSFELYDGFRRAQFPSGATWQTGVCLALSAGWNGFAVLLLAVGLRWRDIRLRALASVIGILSTAMLILATCQTTGSHWTPIMNLRCFAFVVSIAAWASAAWLVHQRSEDLTANERESVAATALVAPALLLWLLTQETYEAFRFFHPPMLGDWTRPAQMAISLVWSVYGVALLIYGIARDRQSLRLVGLGLLSLTIIKAFSFDLGFLDGVLRVLSFGALGIALIGIAWLYSRFGPAKTGKAAGSP